MGELTVLLMFFDKGSLNLNVETVSFNLVLKKPEVRKTRTPAQAQPVT